MIAKWFWLLIVIAVIAWYSVVTVYVGMKGGKDIKHMLARLKALLPNDE